MADTKVAREPSSLDEDLKHDSHRLSEELTTHKSASSAASEDSKVYKKSFGVRKMEVMLDQLDNFPLKFLHIFGIFIGMYVSVVETKVTSVFVSYATESYKQHSLMSTISLIRTVVAASSLPAFARLSDIFGRFELFCFGLILRIVGLIVMSQASTIHKYAGGIVLYGCGFAGARILFQISAQDATSLRYRILGNAIVVCPTIITTWSSGQIVDQLLETRGWKFGIALWAFTFPLACVPYLVSYVIMKWKAIHTPEWQQLRAEEKESQVEMREYRAARDVALQNKKGKFARILTHLKFFGHYSKYKAVRAFWEVDFVACLFIVLIFGLILVPMMLAGGVHSQWKTAKIIVPLVLGFCCVPFFVLWELKFARTPLIPFPLLRDRGVWSGFIIAILSTFSSGVPNTYAYPVLLVGMNASKVVATRTPQLSGFVSSLVLPVLGFVVLKVRRTKGFILFGCCVLFIAMGLFVHFRGDNDGIRDKYFRDGLAIAFVIEGFASGFFMRPVGISIQTCTNHEYMATVSALFASIYNIGGACAKCVAGAIWTQKMYPTIVKHMKELGVNPELAKNAYKQPYKFITTAKWGTPARRAVALAYAEVQKQLCIVALCLVVPLFFFAFFLRDHRLGDHQSLEDELVEEKGQTAAERRKEHVVFTNDDDIILRYLKKVFTFGRK